jgi:mono/diheme cytochrome c family protein
MLAECNAEKPMAWSFGRVYGAVIIAAAVIAGAPTISCFAAEPSVSERGRALLEKNCSRCHAIGSDDVSPKAEAPPFRVVVSRYPAEFLAESLAEGIMTRHSEMPEFVFAPDEIEAIVTYLDTLAPEKAD